MSDLATSVILHWHGHPDVLIGLFILQGGYLIGIGPARKKFNLSQTVDPGQTLLFSSGVFVIFIALLSPLHALSDDYMFSAHMVQHVLLTLVSPPLLILGIPDWLISPIFKRDLVRKLAKILFHPISAVVIFNVIFSIWHIPILYGLSVTHHSVHIFEHMLFMIASFVMWWPLCSNSAAVPRLSYPLQIIYLFVMSLAQIIVFGIVTFAPEPIYNHYLDTPKLFGVSALIDQQLGGIIMKVGSGFLFLSLIITAFLRWFSEGSKNDKKGYNQGIN
jgi:putative membrane protein|tara:strand:- start:984 stop:1808 length:825 start_codon:yes stop_codon:yes gene_type:complete